MNKIIVLSVALLGVSACSQQSQSLDFGPRPLSSASDVAANWQPSHKVEPRYPKEAVAAGEMGCATLEYLITPSGEAAQMRIVSRTDERFSDAAIEALSRWQWQPTEFNKSHQTLKSQTRFDFCIELNGEPCKRSLLDQTCEGSSSVTSTAKIYTQVR
ncbi:energy transducer TonB [Aeromonas molluscorum]|jgi:periplasmic protein TonB|uniref:energy transducer TonB n=1 Tax=Aeromonas molluscorum TaxID=271417 RepID=UPI003F1AAABE